MALTLALTAEKDLGPGLKRIFFKATFDSSYPTGGEAIDFSAGIFANKFRTEIYGVEILGNSDADATELAKGIPVYLNDDLTDLDGGTLVMMDGGSETANATDLSDSIWYCAVDGV